MKESNFTFLCLLSVISIAPPNDPAASSAACAAAVTSDVAGGLRSVAITRTNGTLSDGVVQVKTVPYLGSFERNTACDNCPRLRVMLFPDDVYTAECMQCIKGSYRQDHKQWLLDENGVRIEPLAISEMVTYYKIMEDIKTHRGSMNFLCEYLVTTGIPNPVSRRVLGLLTKEVTQQITECFVGATIRFYVPDYVTFNVRESLRLFTDTDNIAAALRAEFKQLLHDVVNDMNHTAEFLRGEWTPRLREQLTGKVYSFNLQEGWCTVTSRDGYEFVRIVEATPEKVVDALKGIKVVENYEFLSKIKKDRLVRLLREVRSQCGVSEDARERCDMLWNLRQDNKAFEKYLERCHTGLRN